MRAIRMTGLLERLFVKERWRLKIIPDAGGEMVVLKLLFRVTFRASECQHSVRLTRFEWLLMEAMKKGAPGKTGGMWSAEGLAGREADRPLSP